MTRSVLQVNSQQARARLVILAHNLRDGGGKLVAMEICRYLAEQGACPCAFVLPDDSEYRALGEFIIGIGGHRVHFTPIKSFLKYFWFEALELPTILKTFDCHENCSHLVLGGRPVLGLPRQILFVQDAHLCYPVSEFGRESLPNIAKFLVLRFLLRVGLSNIQSIGVQTQTMLTRLQRAYGTKQEMFILPNVGLNFSLSSESAGAETRPLKVFLPCRFYAHKNLEVLLSCAGYLRQHYPALELVFVLTVFANDSILSRDFFRRVANLQLTGYFHLVGNVDWDMLTRLYQESWAVVVPSWLESFSSTYLEAMRAGRPVLASDRDFAREICGDAALYFQPDEGSQLAKQILSLLESPHLVTELTARGNERLAYWETKSRVAFGSALLTRIPGFVLAS